MKINWLTCVIAPLLYLVAVLIVMWPMVGDPNAQQFFGIGDAWTYAAPVLHYGDYWIHEGELPQWNPLYNCGQPFAANPQSFLFYPPNFIRSLLTFNPTPHKTVFGINILIILQLTFGGWGAYLLARSHKLDFGPSLVAGLIYCLGGAALLRAMGHWYFHNALVWVPYVFVAARYAIDAETIRRKLTWAIAAGVAYGMILLAGTPHFMVLTGFLLAIYWFTSRLALRDWSAKTKGLVGNLGSDVAALGVVVVIGVLIASPLLLPAIEFSSMTMRQAEGDSQVEVIDEMGRPMSLWQVLVLYTGNLGYEGFRGAGVCALILAFTALLFEQRRYIVIYALLTLAALDCSLDDPLILGEILFKISPYKMSAPGRGALIFCLPLGMLAAFGCQAIVNAREDNKWQLLLTGVVVASALVTITTLFLSTRPHPYLEVDRLPYVAPIAFAVMALGAIWLRERKIMGPLLALMLFLEIFAWGRLVVPHYMANKALILNRDVASMKQRQQMWDGNGRTTDKQPNMNLYSFTASINGYDPLFIEDVADVTTSMNISSSFRRAVYHDEITRSQYSGNLFLKRQFWLTRQYAVGDLPPRNRPFPCTTTVYLDRRLPSGLRQIDAEEVPTKAVSEMATAKVVHSSESEPFHLDAASSAQQEQAVLISDMPLDKEHNALAITVSATHNVRLDTRIAEKDTGNQEFGTEITISPTREGTANYYQIPLPDFDNIELALVPEFVEGAGDFFVHEMLLLADKADEGDLITIENRTANTVDLSIGELDGPRVLLFVDAFYPGWRAYVDGAETEILKANGAFKAIQLPTGAHEVRFVFSSWRVYAGIAISLITFAAVAVFLFREWRMTTSQRS